MGIYKKNEMTFVATIVVPIGRTINHEPRNSRGHVLHSEYKAVRKLWLGVARSATASYQEVGLAHVRQALSKVVMFGYRLELDHVQGSNRVWMNARYWEIDGEPGIADDLFSTIRLVSAPTCTVPECKCSLPPVFDGYHPRPVPNCCP